MIVRMLKTLARTPGMLTDVYEDEKPGLALSLHRNGYQEATGTRFPIGYFFDAANILIHAGRYGGVTIHHKVIRIPQLIPEGQEPEKFFCETTPGWEVNALWIAHAVTPWNRLRFFALLAAYLIEHCPKDVRIWFSYSTGDAKLARFYAPIAAGYLYAGPVNCVAGMPPDEEAEEVIAWTTVEHLRRRVPGLIAQRVRRVLR